MSRSALAAGVQYLRDVAAAQQHREDSDEQLLRAFVDQGEEAAFTALVRRHGPMVLGVCRRILGHQQDAEDAFQAVFLVLSRRAAVLRDKNAVAGFLHRTAYHFACKIQRSAGRRREEAGRRLGLKQRMVSNRLAEARRLLQGRLSRRGVELTAVLAAVTMAAPSASALPIASLPPITTTVSPAVVALRTRQPN